MSSNNDVIICTSNCLFLRAIWDKEPKLVFKNMMKLPERSVFEN